MYGTSFNVITHQEGNIQTVLVKGSVGVKDFGIRRGEYDKAWTDGRV